MIRRRPPTFVARLLHASVAFTLLIGGCTSVQPVPTPVAVERVEPAPPSPPPPPPPAPTPVAPAPKAPTPTPVTPPVDPAPLRTAVLVSGPIPAFSDVAAALGAQLGRDRVDIVELSRKPSNLAAIAPQLAAADRIVAVGLPAAIAARQLELAPMVFCQVFNYQDEELLADAAAGVQMLPPFALQLDAWMNLTPGLSSVGIVIGPGQDALVDEIRAATADRNVRLTVRVVGSDKEALYEFKRLTPDIQGIWLLPDNRVLSPEVVREMMSYSVRHRKQVVVFGNGLLELGGLLSITSDPDDIAARVIAALDDASDQNRPATMMPLTRLNVEVNDDVARHLGLTVTPRTAQVIE